MGFFEGVFKTLCPAAPGRLGARITVELKNGAEISGNIDSVDQFLNIRLVNVSVDASRFPHLASLSSCFVRGSVIRYVHLPPNCVDLDLVADASRKDQLATSAAGGAA
eukprot:TRINITY_DN22983_c0_g1_i1.p1 TRINITY_DN22983_c0_g1~~TRINITY_DN22983_c0_g1_i1.p1  ORF type:complete len:126 (-),score=11.28 TRINITY_DN22983_c0_g1_i1:143-466(-)